MYLYSDDNILIPPIMNNCRNHNWTDSAKKQPSATILI